MMVPDANFVQLISFSNKVVQLPLYLEVMERAGFTESGSGQFKSRQVRQVPNRKWYNYKRPPSDASSEVLLVHRLNNSRA